MKNPVRDKPGVGTRLIHGLSWAGQGARAVGVQPRSLPYPGPLMIGMSFAMTTTGGYLREIPEPHRRKWPESKERRTVSVSLGRFTGFPHWHVTIREEDNPIWDSRDAAEWKRPGEAIGWTLCWDDHSAERKGKTFDGTFDSQSEAMRFIEQVTQEYFPLETHRVFINCEDAEFYYARVGD